MTTLWITAYPPGTRLSAHAIVAVRDAMRVLNQDQSITAPDAFEILQERLPICLGATEAQTAVEAASALLGAQQFQSRVDLSPEQVEALRTDEVAPAAEAPDLSPDDGEDVIYETAVARVALVLMQHADGNPVSALGAAANLANAIGESPDYPGVFFDAGELLADAFDASAQMATMRAMAAGQTSDTGLDTPSDED